MIQILQLNANATKARKSFFQLQNLYEKLY